MTLSTPQGSPCHTSSPEDEQGTLPLAMPVAIKPKICLAGWQNTTSSVCAWIHGVGKVKIPEGIMPKKTAQRRFLRHYDSHVLFTMLLNLLNPLIRLGVRGQYRPMSLTIAIFFFHFLKEVGKVHGRYAKAF